MTDSLALAAQVAEHGPGFGPGFGLILFFVLIPLFWIALIALFAGLGRRRWAKAGGPSGWGHGGWGHGGPGWGHGHGGWAARGAEASLAERFAQGDIDEKEYRARLEVLRTNNGSGPAKP